MKRAIITQSNYIPWKGFFDGIAAVDLFVVYDEVQFTKRDWRSRNVIKTPSGLKWLSIPVEVSGKYHQKIKDTKVADLSWNINHWNIIKQNYSPAPYYREVSDWLEPLYKHCSFEFLTDINMYFIVAINKVIGINTMITKSYDYREEDGKTQRLVNICSQFGITDYYSGPAAKAYMDETLFKASSVNLHYWNNDGYPEYKQLFGDFTHHVSVLDLFFNVGLNCKKYLKYT